MTDDELDNLIKRLATMGRAELCQVIESLQTRFRLDFTEEFLAELPIDKLRHVTLAACLHSDDPLTRCA